MAQDLPHPERLAPGRFAYRFNAFLGFSLKVIFHTSTLLRFPLWSFFLFEGELPFRTIPSSLCVAYAAGTGLLYPI